MPPRIFRQLFREAERAARGRAEAEDLFQTVWLAAIEAGRGDLSSPANRRWFVGALRKRAMFDARTAIRRRAREERAALRHVHTIQTVEIPAWFLERLPPKLRTTAMLVLTGHNKSEILWLLRIQGACLPPTRRRYPAALARRGRRLAGRSLGARRSAQFRRHSSRASAGRSAPERRARRPRSGRTPFCRRHLTNTGCSATKDG